MRELTFNEIQEVEGGVAPIVYIAGALIAAAGSAIGGYLAGKSNSNSGTSANGSTVQCPEGTAPRVTSTEASCVKIQ